MFCAQAAPHSVVTHSLFKLLGVAKIHNSLEPDRASFISFSHLELGLISFSDKKTLKLFFERRDDISRASSLSRVE